MVEEAQKLSTGDLILEEPPKEKAGLPSRQAKGSGVSVTGAASSPAAAAPAPAPRRPAPAVLSRPIKERSRSKPGENTADLLQSGTTHSAKAAALFEEALQAQKSGDMASAIRNAQLAVTFNPEEPRYKELLKRLKR